jgi:apolipoprotein N-acyltransferase
MKNKKWLANITVLTVVGSVIYFFWWLSQDFYHNSGKVLGVGLLILIFLVAYIVFKAAFDTMRGKSPWGRRRY